MKGLVDVTFLTAPGCAECSNITMLKPQLTLMGVALGKTEEISYDSAAGKALVAKYKIAAVPTVIFSSDAALYSALAQVWPNVGTVEAGDYVLRAVNPPFINLTTGRKAGIVRVVYLDDASCKECQLPRLKTIIESSFGFEKAASATYDISSEEGKALVAKYGIKAVPTVILQGDTLPYADVVDTWKQLGTLETDNALVWRDLSVLDAAYRNLTTGKVVASAGTATAAAATGTTGAAVVEQGQDNGNAAGAAQVNASAPAANSSGLEKSLAEGLS